MKTIKLMTDAPKHNLALMKISAYHKAKGDQIILNNILYPADYTYASILFEKNKDKFKANSKGGPAYVNSMAGPNRNLLPPRIEKIKPDYSLFSIDYSLGYTFRPCFRNCGFCKVPSMVHTDKLHHSIFEFHDTKFDKICLLNNNTFFDKQWLETFEEIWSANLTIIDENGYDLRLIDEEKAWALKKTKFKGLIHFAWDSIENESLILGGLRLIKKVKLYPVRIYVLIGYNSTFEQDLHRCQKIVDFGYDPYIMPFKQTKPNMKFKRFIDTFMWRKYKTLKEAWLSYKP